MTPEVAVYLAKAREFLAKAETMLACDWPDEAARAAYMAGFHAAEAFIFARTGEVTKTHSGLRSVFARLAQEEPRLERSYTRFLARAYSFKEAADYGIGPHAAVTVSDAEELMKEAAVFVGRVAEILA